ncbi:MAG: TIGR02757 family protein, partial [Chitinophagaceae bacterium]
MKEKLQLKAFLDKKVNEYNQPSFIPHDPISVPHLFTKKQDIEIAGFFASIFAWGNRTIIINKSKELMQLMDNDPHNFIVHHSEKELQTLVQFKHR